MRLIEVTESKYKIYVDMDGVLVDFLKGIEKLLGHKHSEEKYKRDKHYRNRFWKVVRDYDKVDGQDFWLELDKLPDAMELWNYVKKHDPEILTAAGTIKGAGEQKKEWIKTELGSKIKTNVVTHSEDKGPQFGKENAILIDDMQKSIDPWVKAGGIGIRHTSAANTIKELKKLGL